MRETGTQTAADKHQSDQTDVPSSSAPSWSCVILSVAGPPRSPPCPKSTEVKRIAVTTRTSHFIILQRGVKHGVISLYRIDHEDVSWQDISGVAVLALDCPKWWSGNVEWHCPWGIFNFLSFIEMFVWRRSSLTDLKHCTWSQCIGYSTQGYYLGVIFSFIFHSNSLQSIVFPHLT